jgi:hypothetical protein
MEEDMDHRTSEVASAVIGHPAAGDASPFEIDLQAFCVDDEMNRLYLRTPFSHGEFTYATNGAYAVRVARRPGVVEAEVPKAADVLDKYFARLAKAQFEPADLSFPNETEDQHKEECASCDGRGLEHECPDCSCKCEDCDGSGEQTIAEKISISVFGNLFRLPFIRKIAALPSVEFAVIPNYGAEEPALFRFDGGVAALMPMRRKGDRHFEIPSRAKAKMEAPGSAPP